MSPSTRVHAQIAAWLGASIASVCLLTAGGSMTTTDAVVAYDVTRSIVEDGSVATSTDLLGKEAYRGRDGRYYSPFGIAQSIWNIPFYVAARSIASSGVVRVGSPDTLQKAAVTLATIPPVVFIACAVFGLALTLGAPASRALAAGLLTVFATPLWPYSKFGFNQPLAGSFLWVATLAAVAGVRGRRMWLPAAGALAGAALLTRHEMVALVPILTIYVAADQRERRAGSALAFCTGLAPMVAAWCGYNWWRFGSPLDTGYLRDATPEYGSSILAGSAGLLFSPYSSLLLYCPLAVLAPVGFIALWREDRKAAALLASLFIVFFLLYSSLGNWMGGRSYGPRYLVPLVPAFVIPLAFWRPAARGRILLGAIVALSVLVQIPGVLVDYSKVRVALARAGETVAQDTRWTRAPLLLNARAALETVPPAAVDLATGRPHRRVAANAPDLNERLSFSPDLWWNYLFYLGSISGRVALTAAAVLTLMGWLAGYRACALARSLPSRSQHLERS